MSVIDNSLLLTAPAGGGSYQVSRSLRFSSPDSSFLSRTPASAGNRKTWTWAGWVKRSALGTDQNIFGTNSTTGLYFQFQGDNTFKVLDYTGSTSNYRLETTQVFRDVGAWMHILFALDTTLATANDRIKLYVNGTQITAFSTRVNPSQNYDGVVNSATTHTLGRLDAQWYLDAYLADIHFIDGQALDPSSFTTTDLITGQLIPKAYTGSYGTNGFKLNFSDNSTTAALGTDTSGNGNTWTVNNFSVTAGVNNDSLTDTPTSYGTSTGVGGEVRGNYATLNALDTANTLSNGNLQLNNPSTGFKGTRSTVGMSAGKWYFETTYTAIVGPTNTAPALYKPNSTLNTGGGSYGNNYISIVEYPANTLNITLDGWSTTAYSQAGSLPAGTIVGIAFDADSGKIWFSTNGTWLNSGNPAAGTGAVYSSIPAGTYFFGGYAYSTSDQLDFNFGARSFAYTAPSGFKALCDTNLPAPVVAKGSAAMDVKLYTGNGGTQTISGLEFGPDFVWLKRRDAARNHALYDIVRGVKKYLASDSTSAEYEPASGGVSSFDSSSFTVVEQGGVAINESSASMVAWTWDAGTSTVTNTAGSITSQVRASTTLSVVTWTGTGSSATVGHGLGVAPSMVIVKRRDAAGWDWPVWHTKLTSGVYSLFINNTNAEASRSDIWSSAPSSTVFNFGNSGQVNGSGGTYVCYAFSSVSGYSSFGSYVGNGSSTDNTFVYTGMRPRFVMLKRSDSTGNWVIWDAVRNSYNVANSILLPNSSAAEYSPDAKIDILSNGFKVRDNSGDSGSSGGTYIYAAFAENPFQYARAR